MIAISTNKMRIPIILLLLLLTASLFLVSCSTPQEKSDKTPNNKTFKSTSNPFAKYHAADIHPSFDSTYIKNIINSRATPEINQTILGALIYLADTQTLDRPGKHSSMHDFCDTASAGCNSVILINKRQSDSYKERILKLKNFHIRNIIGEWATTVHFLPDKLGSTAGEAKIAIQDSNVFSTAGILYPLYFIDEEALPKSEKFITNIRTSAANSLHLYKRNNSYNFWIESEGETSRFPKTGPLNIPTKVGKNMGILLTGVFNKLWQRFTKNMDVGGEDWVKRVLDKNENPYGFDAAFNIPNDTDDTSTVVAVQKYHSLFHPEESINPDLAALNEITRFVDKERTIIDERDLWTGTHNSGAYLTWLKDENLETFSDPASGIITHGVNNIDCVVNANALFSLALNNAQSWKGFNDAKYLLSRTITEKLWINNKCGLYYPQLMMFPYTISRAYREGGLNDDPVLVNAMGQLLKDILELQYENGAFPGGKDRTHDLPTALAVSAILNIGAETASQHGLLNSYQSSIEKGIQYLISARTLHPVLFPTTFALNGNNSDLRYGYKWQSGLYFSTSFWDLAHWRSEPYTAAIILEALVKFVIAYDVKHSRLIDGDRLRIQSYDSSVEPTERPTSFFFTD
jgi:hypothetical protein